MIKGLPKCIAAIISHAQNNRATKCEAKIVRTEEINNAQMKLENIIFSTKITENQQGSRRI